MTSYDQWKTTNPADEFLGPDPHDEESEEPAEIDNAAIGRMAAEVLAKFPLPAGGLTAIENYRRVLDWLYSGDVAALIVALSYGYKRGRELDV